MKAIKALLTALVTLSVTLSSQRVEAQAESSNSFDVGADFYTNYIWRGSKFGTGPAVQPYLEFQAGNFTLGSWGSFGITDNESAEADLYLSYSFDFGLSLGITDYYYPGSPYFDYTPGTNGAHGFEANLTYALGSFSLGANYMLNEAGIAGTVGGDMYFELGYSFDSFDIFAGAGDGWHTSDGEFGVCNIGISTSKNIEVSDSFSIPVSGAIILNPDQEQFYVVVGLSF